MSISGIGSSNLSFLSQQMQNFKTGKSNIQKEEIEQVQSQMGDVQSPISDMFSSLLESFDEVDANGDGLSFEELTEFAKTQGSEGSDRQKRPQGAGGPSGKEGVSLTESEDVQSETASSGPPSPPASEDTTSTFDSLDTNQDGKVSMSEIMANIQQEREAFDAQSASSEVNVSDIFNKFLEDNGQENKTNNLFKNLISQYPSMSTQSA